MPTLAPIEAPICNERGGKFRPVRAADTRATIGTSKDIARIVARECDMRLAQADKRVFEYDLKEGKKSDVYHPTSNPMGRTERFKDVEKRMRRELRTDYRKHEHSNVMAAEDLAASRRPLNYDPPVVEKRKRVRCVTRGCA